MNAIGCGKGRLLQDQGLAGLFTAYLGQIEYTGLDGRDDYLEEASQQYACDLLKHCRFVCRPFQEVTTGELGGPFDVVLCINASTKSLPRIFQPSYTRCCLR
jgi:2-polyprenyl-3-methyl-5-hydroxy-6-metoxy-1,4-benzoquinol methylase